MSAIAPSLECVPGKYNTGLLFSQLPMDGSGDFTVTRTTTPTAGRATRVNAAGLIETVADNVPRLDYPIGGGCPALLVEPSAQNLILQSQFGAGWFAAASAQVTVNTTGTLDPLGTNTAARLFCRAAPSGSAEQGFFQTGVNLSSGVHTISVFAKKANNFDWIRLTFLEAGGVASHNAYFNLLSGTVGTVSSGSTATIQNYGNGWYRITQSRSIVSGTNCGIRVNLASANNTASVTVDGDSGSYIWGAQLETGSVATSYIPTTTAAVTRNADLISVSGAVSGSIGQTEGTIYCEFAYFGTPAIRSGPIYLRQGAGARGLSINYSPSDLPLGISFISRNDGGSTALTIVSGALQIGTYYKIAIGYDAGGTAAGGSQANGVVAYVNGVQTAVGTLRVPEAGGLTEFRMYGANAGTDAEAFNGRIRAAALFTSRLTTEELIIRTAPIYNENLADSIWENYLARPSLSTELPECLRARHNEIITI